MTLTITPTQSIQQTLNDNPSLTHLVLLEGIYNEKIVVFHEGLIIEGKGEVVITYGDYAKKIHSDQQPFNTFRTPTLTVFSSHVTLRNLVIKNEAGLSKGVGQAVALALYGDHSLVENTIIVGHQDTLFLGPLPKDLVIRYENFLSKEHLHTKQRTHVFRHCKIYGDVDFIFGSGHAFFIDCHIIQTDKGYMMAPSTYQGQLGFIFYHCHIENRSPYPNYLARPWRDHAYNAFIDCRFSGLFHKDRYHDWDKSTFYFYEHPYVKSPLSKPLTDQQLNQLTQLIKMKNSYSH